MGRNNYFQFKKFTIVQEHSAMKVGTDGVLLGAWADVASAKTILDVGTGTGLITLMMAQRSAAKIVGIEIESKAAEEAENNALNSPWSQRITVINISFQDFVKTNPGSFDLIISNPPFFGNSQKSRCEMLAMAKHNHLLPPSDLISCSSRLLAPEGKFATIIPADSILPVKVLAEKEQLYLLRETAVRPNNLKKPHRYLLEFGKDKIQSLETNFLCIHNDNGNDFTDQYKALTCGFYLNF
jgi:tRNA1Val (adenine37-N6)-methyltransferase